MFSYLLILLGAAGHIFPHAWLPFTAVGGSLLYFGARRPLWQAVLPVALLATSDYYLTTAVYRYPFAIHAYLLTWVWYAAVIVLGFILLRQKTTVARAAAAATLAPTSFFLVSNFAVWAGQPSMYPHTLAGLATCYTAAIPFYAYDLISTGVVVAAVFGIPALRTQRSTQQQAALTP